MGAPSDMLAAKYILWLDYGQEGWLPKPFDSMPALIEFTLRGNTHGNPFIVTRPITLMLNDPENKQGALE